MLGARGERRAARWYRRRGYRVVDRNWRGARGEIDLVLRRGSLVVFCEVKTRSSRRYGLPAEAVSAAKQQRLRRVAVEWLAAHRARRRVRFDVAAVEGGRVRVYQRAF